MKIMIPSAIISTMIACSPVQKEEATATTQDSTVAVSSADSISSETLPQPTAAVEAGEEYVIEDGYSYITDPFDFSLDSASVREMLGPDAIFSVIDTPAGEDEEGSYDGYTYYQVSAPDAKINFYSYSGKHFADVTTSKVPFKNGVVVGMSKSDFIKAMNLPDEALKAGAFGIYDDYGSMSFEFTDDKLTHIYVSYEEGT